MRGWLIPLVMGLLAATVLAQAIHAPTAGATGWSEAVLADGMVMDVGWHGIQTRRAEITLESKVSVRDSYIFLSRHDFAVSWAIPLFGWRLEPLLEFTATAPDGEPFRLMVFDDESYELWERGAPAKPIADLKGNSSYRFEVNLTSLPRKPSYLAFIGTREGRRPPFFLLRARAELEFHVPPPIPLIETLDEPMYVPHISYSPDRSFFPIQMSFRRPPERLVVEGRFQSDKPVSVKLSALDPYDLKESTAPSSEIYWRATGVEGSFRVEPRLVRERGAHLLNIYFIVEPTVEEYATVRLWMKARWLGGEVERSGKTQERVVRVELEPKYVKKTYTSDWRRRFVILDEDEYESLLPAGPDQQYWTKMGACFQHYLEWLPSGKRVVIEAEELSGKRFSLLLLDDYNLGLLKEGAAGRPLAKAGPGPRLRLEYGFGDFYRELYAAVTRVDEGELAIRYNITWTWWELNPKGVRKIDIVFDSSPKEPVNRIDLELESDKPINVYVIRRRLISHNFGPILIDSAEGVRSWSTSKPIYLHTLSFERGHLIHVMLVNPLNETVKAVVKARAYNEWGATKPTKAVEATRSTTQATTAVITKASTTATRPATKPAETGMGWLETAILIASIAAVVCFAIYLVAEIYTRKLRRWG